MMQIEMHTDMICKAKVKLGRQECFEKQQAVENATPFDKRSQTSWKSSRLAESRNREASKTRGAGVFRTAGAPCPRPRRRRWGPGRRCPSFRSVEPECSEGGSRCTRSFSQRHASAPAGPASEMLGRIRAEGPCYPRSVQLDECAEECARRRL